MAWPFARQNSRRTHCRRLNSERDCRVWKVSVLQKHSQREFAMLVTEADARFVGSVESDRGQYPAECVDRPCRCWRQNQRSQIQKVRELKSFVAEIRVQSLCRYLLPPSQLWLGYATVEEPDR